jgi:hypothetical protein
MPHTFRTIEQFMQLLETKVTDHRRKCRLLYHLRGSAYFQNDGSARAFQEVIDILRTSNIGIVNPPQDRQPFADWWNAAPERDMLNVALTRTCPRANFMTIGMDIQEAVKAAYRAGQLS